MYFERKLFVARRFVTMQRFYGEYHFRLRH